MIKSSDESFSNPARPEIDLQDSEPVQDQIICTGYVPVVLSKMFGPLIFCDIRIRAVPETCQWVIEVEHITKQPDGDDKVEWREHCRIEGQASIEFND